MSYVAWTCERALERGMLPHTNVGVCSREELARLREVTASQGLMLESVNPGPRGPPGLADQAPAGAARRHQDRRRAADPVHQRHPGRDRRVA